MACTPDVVAGTAVGRLTPAAALGFFLAAFAAAVKFCPSPSPGIAVTGRPLLPKTADVRL